jgi:aminoglycoside 3-N-acetyltransferase
MVSFRDFVNAFREVGLNPRQPVIVHAALSTTGQIRGGAETVLGALLAMARGVMAPTFTYDTMIIPEVGPVNNAMTYGMGGARNRNAEFFRPDMPADPSMGILPETIRKHPDALRSMHPILSFAGIGVESALRAQTYEEPMAPIGQLTRENGIVLLIGVDHTANTSIHYGEVLAGRKQFVRWALTPQGVRECPHFNGCSEGFEQAAPYLEPITRSTRLGSATIKAIQLAPMVQIICGLVKEQPLALLCNHGDARCAAVRKAVEASSQVKQIGRGASAAEGSTP